MKEHYCPKCGSTYIQSETEGAGTMRFHRCMSCGHLLYRSFPTKPPKNPKIKPRLWEDIVKNPDDYSKEVSGGSKKEKAEGLV